MTGLVELFHGSLGELVMFCQCGDQEREDWAGDQGGDQSPRYQESNTGQVRDLTLLLGQDLGYLELLS